MAQLKATPMPPSSSRINSGLAWFALPRRVSMFAKKVTCRLTG